MSPTGTPLILLVILTTVAALAATAWIWTRARRARILLRTLGVLLTEALLLISVGLVVNRDQQFYPTWASLLQTGSTIGTTYAVTPGHLDQWLRAQAGDHPNQSVAFTWQPAGWVGWHLAGAPTVVTPTAYLQHPGWRYPALLVIDDSTGGWTPAAEAAAARAAGTTAGPAIMVFARTTPATTVPTLSSSLPAALTRDLRVTGHRWALVAGAADAGLARQSVATASARYPAVALVQDTAAQNQPNQAPNTGASAAPGPIPGGSVRQRPARPGTSGSTPRSLPAGVAVVVVGPAPAAPSTSMLIAASFAALPAYLTADGDNALQTALVWACQQTPPPLAASTPPVTHLPVQHHPPHHLRVRSNATPGRSAVGSSPAATRPAGTSTRPGGNRVPGQPGD